MPATGTRDALFASTRWTLVLQAGAKSNSAARNALKQLCQIYWLGHKT
jgi:hypothetical protein